jgi:hypothetical protein
LLGVGFPARGGRVCREGGSGDWHPLGESNPSFRDVNPVS